MAKAKLKVHRKKQLKVWVSENEHLALANNAVAHGLKSSDVIRQFIRSMDEYGDLVFADPKSKKVSR